MGVGAPVANRPFDFVGRGTGVGCLRGEGGELIVARETERDNLLNRKARIEWFAGQNVMAQRLFSADCPVLCLQGKSARVEPDLKQADERYQQQRGDQPVLGIPETGVKGVTSADGGDGHCKPDSQEPWHPLRMILIALLAHCSPSSHAPVATIGGMDLFDEIVRLRRAGQKCALATIVQVNGSIPSYESAKLLVREDGSMIGTIGGGCVEAEVWNAAREVIGTERPRHMKFSLGQDAAYDNGLICGGQLEVFVEPLVPQPKAYIFGAGHISKSLCKVASVAGFAVTVADNREQYANRERFPEAEDVFAEEYEDLFPRLQIRDTSYLIIVTRGHRDDMRVLRWAIETPARYIAMIGSKRKVLGVMKELEKEGINASGLERLFAPMGFEIGAITPEEIAISVVAEMIAARRNPEVSWRTQSKSIFQSGTPRALMK